MFDRARPDDTSLEDRELVARFLKSGDEATFRELYRRHTPLLYRVSVRLLYGESHGMTAEDATQECWLRATRGLAGFGWRSTLATWLVGIAVRVCAEARRVPAVVHGLDEFHENLPPALDVATLESADLERLLAALPPGYRAVVILHDIEGLTHEEIGTALGISPGTAKSQLARGRRALRDAAEPGSATGRAAS